MSYTTDLTKRFVYFSVTRQIFDNIALTCSNQHAIQFEIISNSFQIFTCSGSNRGLASGDDQDSKSQSSVRPALFPLGAPLHNAQPTTLWKPHCIDKVAPGLLMKWAVCGQNTAGSVAAGRRYC